jgi:hypothetical protein
VFPAAVEELGIRELLDAKIVGAACRGMDRFVLYRERAARGGAQRGSSRRPGHPPLPPPVAEIAFFKYDDFELWVDDSKGNEVAVVAVAPRGTGDGRVQVLHVHRPDTPDTAPPPDWGGAAFGMPPS